MRRSVNEKPANSWKSICSSCWRLISVLYINCVNQPKDNLKNLSCRSTLSVFTCIFRFQQCRCKLFFNCIFTEHSRVVGLFFSDSAWQLCRESSRHIRCDRHSPRDLKTEKVPWHSPAIWSRALGRCRFLCLWEIQGPVPRGFWGTAIALKSCLLTL